MYNKAESESGDVLLGGDKIEEADDACLDLILCVCRVVHELLVLLQIPTFQKNSWCQL